MKDVLIYDTTLRDGSQGEGVAFSMEDKVRIAQRLDALGIHYIEGGWPGSNPKDIRFSGRFRMCPSSRRRWPRSARHGGLASLRDQTRTSGHWSRPRPLL